MTLKRFVAILAILLTLSIGTLSPRPAKAVDTAVIVISSIAAYVVFVFVGAYIVYGRNPSPLELMPGPVGADHPEDGRPDGVRFGYGCRQADGNLTLACW